MVIYTTAKVRDKVSQLLIDTVWAVDISAYPEAASIVKQLPSNHTIEADEFQGDTKNLRQIDPIQFIDIGIDGRLTGERKELHPTGIRARVPRDSTPDYEHLKLENDEIKWYKETGGQWAFHNATVSDIEKFIQKYLSNNEILVKNRVRQVGSEIVDKVNKLSTIELIGLLNLPKELPDKYNHNFVIKKDNDTMRYAPVENVATVDGNRITAFGTVQTNISRGLCRLANGYISDANLTNPLDKGLYNVRWNAARPERLEKGVYTVNDEGTVESITLEDACLYQYGDLQFWKVTGPEPNKIFYYGSKKKPIISQEFERGHKYILEADYIARRVIRPYTPQGADIKTFEPFGVYLDKAKTPGPGRVWYNMAQPKGHYDVNMTPPSYCQAGWGGQPFVYTTHPEGDPKSIGRYDGKKSPDLFTLLQSEGILEVKRIGTHGGPGRPWDYARWNQVFQVRRIWPKVLKKGKNYKKDNEGYLTEHEDQFLNGHLYIKNEDGFSIYTTHSPVTVNEGIVSEYSNNGDGDCDSWKESLVEGRIYRYSGGSLDEYEADSPIVIKKGTAIDVTLKDLGLSENIIYKFRSGTTSADSARQKYGILKAGGCDLLAYSNYSPELIREGLVSGGCDNVDVESPISSLDPAKVYSVRGDSLIPYDSQGIVVVDKGYPAPYFCNENPEFNALPDDVYFKKHNGSLEIINHSNPVTITAGIPKRFIPHDVTPSASGGHLLAAALLGAGVKEVIDNSMVYEEHDDDESDMDT